MSDLGDWTDLEQDLRTAPAKAIPLIDKAIKFTSVEIKQDWAQGAQTSGDDGVSANYAASIDFEMKYGNGEISSDIGPNPSKRGGRAGFLEDANGDVRAAPQHAGRDAVRANEDDFYRGLEIALFDATAEAVEGS